RGPASPAGCPSPVDGEEPGRPVAARDVADVARADLLRHALGPLVAAEDQRDQPLEAELPEPVVAQGGRGLDGVAVAPVRLGEHPPELDDGLLPELGDRARLPGVGVPDEEPGAAEHPAVLLALDHVVPEAVGLPAAERLVEPGARLLEIPRFAETDVAHDL